MPAGEVGAGGGLAEHQARIVAQQLVWPLAMANPQPLRHFLIPGQRTAAAADLHRQAVFSPGADLRNDKAPLAAIVEAKQDRPQIFGIDGPRFIRDIIAMLAERRVASHGRLARRPDDGEVRHHLHNASAGHKLHRIAPVGTNVGHRPRGPALRRIHPPVIVGLQQHPVLQIAAVHRKQPPDIAVAHHRRRLLHHGKLAINKADAMNHPGAFRQRHQLTGLLRGHAERLF